MSKALVIRIVIVGIIIAAMGGGLTLLDRQRYPDKRQPEPEPVGRRVVIETGKGNIIAVLYEKDAPITTKNFIDLVQSKFYNGLVFHRVEPGFVIQTGDPLGTGMGGSKKTIPLEVTPSLRHDGPGVLGMARKGNDTHSASSQFYITMAATPSLDDQYAVFGRVLEGMDVVAKITVGDKVKRIELLPSATPTKSGSPKK
jgi:peptidyl-prolyl cis-trans isomerase B (cyclophilin B)